MSSGLHLWMASTSFALVAAPNPFTLTYPGSVLEISAERGVFALITKTALWPIVLLNSNSASGSLTFFSSSCRVCES